MSFAPTILRSLVEAQRRIVPQTMSPVQRAVFATTHGICLDAHGSPTDRHTSITSTPPISLHLHELEAAASVRGMSAALTSGFIATEGWAPKSCYLTAT